MRPGLLGAAISRPVAVLAGLAMLMLFGALSVVGLPIQLTPDVEVPRLSVQTRWPGASPPEIEREILQEQEDVLKGLRGLVLMSSEAGSDRGTVTLEFEVGTDLDDALVRVTNRLVQVPSYPESAREPVVSTSDASGPPLAVVLIQDPEGGPVGGNRTWVQEQVLPRLERIPGVSRIDHFGGRDTEVVISYRPHDLASRGVPLDQMVRAVRAELQDSSGGDVDLGKRRYAVRTLATPDSLAGFRDLVLKPGTGTNPAVRLGDVASVDLGLRKQGAKVFGDDHESLALLLRREAGSNVLEVTELIKEEIARIQDEQMAPRGLSIRIASDQTDYIYGALGLVRQNLLLGGLLAALVLFGFLRSFRAAALVSLAIPVCVVGTALGMSLLGRTLNVVSLAGMAFAVGMVVDNAIVVLESIDAWRSKAADAAEAAYEGTREVWGAILASTLTTVAVFVPIIAWQDEVGYLLRDVAIAISLAVSLSLVASELVVPSFAGRLLSVGGPSEGGAVQRIADAVGSFVRRMTSSMGLSGLVAVSAPVAMALLALSLLPPMEYLPTGNRNFLFGALIPPPSYSVPEMTAIGERFQKGMLAHTGEDGQEPRITRSFFVARPGLAFMGAEAVDPDGISDLVGLYRSKQREIPGVIGVASQASLFGRGLASSRSIEVDITGSDLGVLAGIGGRMMGMVREVLPGAQVRPIPSLNAGAPEFQLEPRRDELARNGLTGAELGAAVDALVDGRIVGELARGGQPKLDVVVRPAGGGVATADELRGAPIATGQGSVVPLGTLAVVHERAGPTQIRRIERRRGITIRVSPPDDVALEDGIALLREKVISPLRADLPQDVQLTLAGTADKLSQAQGRMGNVLLLALVISFLLLAALFEDLLAPMVVLVTVPLAAAGGVAGLRLVDAVLAPQPLDMLSALGFVILIGIVVNNAILVVDGALVRLREGASLAGALEGAVARRTRPILMSALTSLAGLLPLVLLPGSGSELYRGVGAIVLGGLALSTALTLFVVPAVFAVVWRIARRA
ncbi:MAG: efflux RND transporter permease subunit [Deltaproteobacteria bacterium]|nr:efflux RND transporter permease subunit [Deltaproteobacteria bacterium]